MRNTSNSAVIGIAMLETDIRKFSKKALDRFTVELMARAWVVVCHIFVLE